MTDRERENLIRINQSHIARIAAGIQKTFDPPTVAGLFVNAALDVLAVSMPRDAAARELIERLQAQQREADHA